MSETKRTFLLTDKAKLDDTGRILVPAEMRKVMGLKAGDYLVLVLDESGLRIMTFDQNLREVQRMLGFPVNRSLADELIQERREEAAHE